MKDLVVITADADMQAVMQAILSRHQALRIHPLDYEVRRHYGRDAGLFRDGPEVTRSLKGEFRHLLMLWDFEGSGQERHATPEDSAASIQRRLDAISWKGISKGLAIVPELEEWIWHCPGAISKCGELDREDELYALLGNYCNRQGKSLDIIRRDEPKELLEFVWRKQLNRLPRPQDYERIARSASLVDWQHSPTFKAVTEQLRNWFPPRAAWEEVTRPSRLIPDAIPWLEGAAGKFPAAANQPSHSVCHTGAPGGPAKSTGRRCA